MSNVFLTQIISSAEIIEVGWKDAQTNGGPGWVDGGEVEEMAKAPPPIMRTVGFLLHEAEDFISMTDSVGPEETGGVTTIPKGMILWMHSLCPQSKGD